MLSDWTAVESSVASIMSDVDFNMPGPSVSPSVLITTALHLYFMFVTRWRCRLADPVQANNSYWGKQLGDAVRNGMIPKRRFDDMVRVCLVLQFQCWWDLKGIAMTAHASYGRVSSAWLEQGLPSRQVRRFLFLLHYTSFIIN